MAVDVTSLQNKLLKVDEAIEAAVKRLNGWETDDGPDAAEDVAGDLTLAQFTLSEAISDVGELK